MRLHLHLLSDSTGETLENIAKAALAQFDDVDTMRHFWPMVRSEAHLERILTEIAVNPGLVLYTLVNPAIRRARSLAPPRCPDSSGITCSARSSMTTTAGSVVLSCT